ncbi:F-box protein CPR1-like [Prosopis cineraria]|uniref:F-box protein CPR1-like n=1 Tax=Prosopis cineraria TaxID=364024 RepID=UPI00240F803C|nr:F-box protein CPR1-like [Prosopis cineraria]XP_054821292.1 F-box protein CPR1-like [Prosopis cineraria]XP_054821293.1 F-box protein CPR1-like [Prosopis cineraria]XP_054821294.1 F-box protein CPR1-like [Prosopis cineraria]XP_054821295.1 F-box protein CPR1-like [Prosopis cineraria]
MEGKQLPQDVMVEILLKLPLESLMRCKILNKSTYALISSCNFIKKHFQLSKSQQGMLAFHCETLTGFSAALLPDDISQPVIDLELPRPSDKIIGEIIPYGPCNGIFCLHFTYLDCTDQLCLWNPVTREVKVLPLPNHHISLMDDFVIHGFGIVPGTNDYKVVRILTSMDFDIEDSKPFIAEVYNLSTNSWRTIDITESAYSLVSPIFCSYLKGVYHWLTLGLSEEAIICFDMSDEVFWKMELPEVYEDDSIRQVTDCNVAVINDTIAYVKEYSLNYSMDSRIDIWVMNEYSVEASWNKRYVIGPGLGLSKFLGFWKEDEILVGEDNQPLIAYNPDARQQVHEFPIHVAEEMFQAFKYVRSIFPLSMLEDE